MIEGRGLTDECIAAPLTLISVNSARPNEPRTMKDRNGSPNLRNLLLLAYASALSSISSIHDKARSKGQ